MWAYPVATEEELDPLEALLYYTFNPKSQLMNGTVPALPTSLEGAPEPFQKVQVMADSEILAKRDPVQRLPRQAAHYAQIVGHFLEVKKSKQIARAIALTSNASPSIIKRFLGSPIQPQQTMIRKTKAVRSAIMRSVKSTDTKPEMFVRRLAHRLGYRFRLHRKCLPGTPDLVFPRLRKVVFVHGCFWHGHGFAGEIGFRRAIEIIGSRKSRGIESAIRLTAPCSVPRAGESTLSGSVG